MKGLPRSIFAFYQIPYGVALDVSTKGITANTIAYGYMNAGMLNDVPQPILDDIRNSIPQDHFGRPEQIVV